MNIKTGMKLAQIGIKGLGKEVSRGGKELAVIVGKTVVLAGIGAVVTYATRENNAELDILAKRKSKQGIDDLETEIASIIDDLETEK